MNTEVLIAHAEGEEDIAEKLAVPLREAGYSVTHRGTVIIGETIIGELSKVLLRGAPVILCGTVKALGTGWAFRVVNAARSYDGVRVFALQIEKEAFIQQLSFNEVFGLYWQDPFKAVQDLITALKKYYPLQSAITQSSPKTNIDNYFLGMRKRYQRLDLEGLTPSQTEEYLQVQLRSVFVEQGVRDNPPPPDFPEEVLKSLKLTNDIDLPENVGRESDVYYEKPPRPVLDVLTDSNNNYVVILGDPGSGKSTLTRYLLLSIIDTSVDNRLSERFKDYLPLLIELRNYTGLFKDNKVLNFIEYLEHLRQTEGKYPEKETLDDYFSKGKAFVIFDGLDEIFDPQDRDDIARQIEGFKETYPKTQIIVTSRIVGYRRTRLTDAGFRHYTLQSLDENQVSIFIKRWYAIVFNDKPENAIDRGQRILRAFKESASIRQLSGNPMLLTIMAIIAKNQELPRERWKLYEHAASVLIEIWDINRYLKNKVPQADFIDEDDKKEMLRRLAYKMQNGKGGLAGNYIHYKELKAEFEEYLKEAYSTQPDRAKVISQAMVQQFRERNFILLLYGANLYGFVHRAFLEFFCATAFTYKFQRSQKLTLEQLKQEAYGDHWEDQSWHEVLRLISGMIEGEFAGEIITYLSSDLYVQWPAQQEFNNSPPWNLALAIKCLGEVKKINLVAEPAKLLLGKICQLFDYDMEYRPQLFLFIKEHVIPLAEMIGASWPENDYLAEILKVRKPLDYAYIYDRLFGTFIGSIGKGSAVVHKELMVYVQHPDERYRVVVPFALAVGWNKDPATLPLLHTLVNNDVNQTVRYAAIYALAEYYNTDPQTLPLLHEHAANDEHLLARSAAITGLAKHYHEDPATFDLLRDRVSKEERKYPRTVLVKALGDYFQNQPETFSILCKLALTDESPKPDEIQYPEPYYVRDAAMDAIFRVWSSHQDTLPLLKNRAENDPTPWLRKKAEEMVQQLS